MKNEFIPYEQALALKELGFNEPCFGYFKDGEFRIPNPHEPFKNSELKSWFVTAPLFSQAFRFFREKYQLDTSINTVYSKYNDTLSKKYSGVIDDKSVFTNIGFYDTYEEAELACIEKLIEIVKKK
jgi:hypothetical protein